MKNKIWKENIEALGITYPIMKKYIEEGKYKESSDCCHAEITLESSYTGEPISRVQVAEKSFYLAGKYCPEATSDRQIQLLGECTYGSTIFVIGIGDGRFLQRIEKREDITIIVYEPCLDIFLHTMENYDIKSLFEDGRVVPIIEGINGTELKTTFARSIFADNVAKVKTHIMWNYERMFGQQVKDAITVLRKLVNQLQSNWKTQAFFEKEILENAIQNYKYLYKHYSVNGLFDSLPENVPAVIVAAGPSLDKNIDLLKEIKGKACIIACDTALKPLLRRDIIPDFFVVVDPKKPIELFEEPRIKEIPLICTLAIPPSVMSMHKGKKIFYDDVPFMKTMFEYVFGEDINREENAMGNVMCGGNVATSAYSAARLLGAKNIILVGQDFALTGEKAHAVGTFKKDEVVDLKKKNYPLVEGIDGKKIPTLSNLKAYLEWLEESIAYYSDVKVIDATEGGALIHGSTVLSLREAIDTYCVGEYNSSEYLERLRPHFNEQQQRKALEFMHEMPYYVEKVKRQLEQGKALYKKLEKCMQKDSYTTTEVLKITKKLKRVNEYLNQDQLSLLIMEGIKKEEYLLRVNVFEFENDEKEDLLKSAQMGISFLDSFEKKLKEVEPLIQKMSEFQGEYEC